MPLKAAVKVVILTMLSGLAIAQNPLRLGIDQVDQYLPLLKGHQVAVCGNQSSLKSNVHLVDHLLQNGISVAKIFSPEHGFRGNHSAGAHISSGKDESTGLPIVSLYGSHKKPTKEDLAGISVVVFDMQDVGARFYTYISTLHYVMQASAESNIPVIVLDRPNPNGHYVDGPILEAGHHSFVGMHEVPIVHGMTIGEYALMINGQDWLGNGLKCDLTIISMKGYTHDLAYTPPIKPSPNLPTRQSILLYPSLCLFEGTSVSVGRGTVTPFEIYGAPYITYGSYAFIPRSMPGISDHPKHEGVMCYGQSLRNYIDESEGISRINLTWLIEAYKVCSDKESFFLKSFDRLAGTSQLREQIIAGKSEDEIRTSWQNGLTKFKEVRKAYLLYP